MNKSSCRANSSNVCTPEALPRSRARRRGITRIEAVVLLAILGTLFCLTGPALLWTRAAAQRNEMKNKLRTLGIALSTYHDVHGVLPSGGTSEPVKKSTDDPQSTFLKPPARDPSQPSTDGAYR